MIAHTEEVVSLNDPRLAPYRTLKQQRDHRKGGIFVAEGTKVVRRLLGSSLTTESVLLSPERMEEFRSLLQARTESVTVFVGSQEMLARIVGFELHQGAMAIARAPMPLTVDEAVDAAASPRLIVALDNLAHAENVGVVVRNCAACGVHAIIVGETSADPYLRRAVRNSMGTVFRTPIVHARHLPDAIRTLRCVHGVQIWAAHARPGSVSVFDADLRTDCCIVLDNEGDGVGPEVLAQCSGALAIPMVAGVDSFNVACAGAAILCEVTRQRGLGAVSRVEP